MTILNNVNVSALEQVIKGAESDKSKVKRTQKIEGEWRFETGGPQFLAVVNFEGGKMVLEADQPQTPHALPWRRRYPPRTSALLFLRIARLLHSYLCSYGKYDGYQTEKAYCQT